MSKSNSGPPSAETSTFATDIPHLRTVADLLPQLVWSCRPDGYCDYLSRRWVAYTGVPEELHHGSGWLDAVHPDDRAQTRAAWTAFVAGRSEYDVDYRLRRHDGEYCWFKTRGTLVRGEGGEPLRVVGTTTDINDQKRAEERIRELDERATFVRKASGVGFWYCDLPLDVLEWDELVKAHFHLAPDARVTIGTFYERIHPDDRQPTREAIERSIAERAGYDVHYRTVHPETGAEKWIRAIGRTFYAPDGTPRQFDGITLDVTTERRAEERRQFLADLAAATQPLTDPAEVTALTARMLAEHLRCDRCAYAEVEGEAIYVITGDYTRSVPSIVGRWPVAAFGAEHHRMMRADEPYIVHDVDADPRIAPDDLPAYRATRIRAVVCVPLLKDGRFTAAMAVHQASPRQWTADEVELVRTVVGRCWEALERARVARERLRAEEQLRDADRRKDEFLAILAHELRNPLAPIRNGLQVMRLAAENPALVARSRDMMDRQLTHMVRLVDDLLDVSRISRGKMELRRERILLSDVVASAVETARPAIDAAGHLLHASVPPEPVYLDGDLTRLAQVLSNLLTNSAKYTPASGQIWLVAERAGSDVMVSVRDTGVGIPAEAQPRIFDMFSQVDRSLERTRGGLGIGLALVKGLVEMHRGSVVVESEGQDRGSTFTVRLPLSPSQPASEPEATGDGHTAHGPRRKILVVDDNRDAALSMAEMLRLLGHEVATAHDGASAVDTAEAFRPEVVLMDIGMPGMNGLDATRAIRRRAWGRGVTIVALTGWGQESDRAESERAGCDGHLVKPIHLSEVEPYLVPPQRR